MQINKIKLKMNEAEDEGATLQCTNRDECIILKLS